jgi:hypothetical protein
MTLPSGSNGGPISISDINSDAQDGYSLGTNLNAYRGQIYDNKSGGVGVFSSGAISLADFYGRRRVDAGSRNVTTSGDQTIPPYRTITLYVYGAGGGGGGGKGDLGYAFCAVNNGNNGGTGNTSSVGSSGDAWYIVGAGGGGGPGGGNGSSPGTDWSGADGSSPAGGAGGAGNDNPSGNAGGKGGRTSITLTNPVLGGTGPTSGSPVPFSFGAGGGGGGGSFGFGSFPPGDCNPNGNNGSDGSSGASGKGGITWTGT